MIPDNRTAFSTRATSGTSPLVDPTPVATTPLIDRVTSILDNVADRLNLVGLNLETYFDTTLGAPIKDTCAMGIEKAVEPSSRADALDMVVNRVLHHLARVEEQIERRNAL